MGKREMTEEHELLIAVDRELCTDPQPFLENRERFIGPPEADERLSHRPTAARHPRRVGRAFEFVHLATVGQHLDEPVRSRSAPEDW